MRHNDVVGVKVEGRASSVGHVRYSAIIGYCAVVYYRDLTGKRAPLLAGGDSDFLGQAPFDSRSAAEQWVRETARGLLDSTLAVTKSGKLVDVVPCRPCDASGLVTVMGGTVATCCVCGGRGHVIKGGFFDTDNPWTVRMEVLPDLAR